MKRVTKIRTLQQALAAAVKIVGKKATVEKRACYHSEGARPPGGIGPREWLCVDHGRACDGRPVYVVGRVMLGLFNEINGQGDSWEEALAEAALRRHEFCSACFQKKPCRDGDRLRAAVASFRLAPAAPDAQPARPAER